MSHVSLFFPDQTNTSVYPRRSNSSLMTSIEKIQPKLSVSGMNYLCTLKYQREQLMHRSISTMFDWIRFFISLQKMNNRTRYDHQATSDVILKSVINRQSITELSKKKPAHSIFGILVRSIKNDQSKLEIWLMSPTNLYHLHNKKRWMAQDKLFTKQGMIHLGTHVFLQKFLR